MTEVVRGVHQAQEDVESQLLSVEAAVAAVADLKRDSELRLRAQAQQHTLDDSPTRRADLRRRLDELTVAITSHHDQ